MMKTLIAATSLVLAAAPALADDVGPEEAGKAQFTSTCSACHQVTGLGIKGAFPALAGDAFVIGDPAAVIMTVLNGRGGMPAWKDDLSDAQIAAAISYIRSAWGNAAPPVTPAMVAAARGGAAPPVERALQTH
jgi:mono/diheme cytochrome c family protein